MSFTSMLIDRCTVSRPTVTTDDAGTQTEVYAPVYTGIRCYSEHYMSGFDAVNGRVGTVSRHILCLEKKYLVRTGDKVEIQGETGSYRMTFCDDRHHHHIECELAQLESPQQAGGLS